MKESTEEFPETFAKRMNDELGEAWQAFSDAHHMPAPVSVRLHPHKSLQSIDNPIPWSSRGKYLSERPVYTLDPLFHGGAYYVQEASSMFLEQAFRQCIDSTDGIRVLDLSAAPGGKSTHLLSLLDGKGLLVSNEVIQSRASILSENIQKWGYANVLVTNSDPSAFTRLEGFFDVIVVDAPCSGEGLFRKDPSAMREWSVGNVQLCAARQTRILHDVWPALKENGVLIYSTCTYNANENEDNLINFSKEYESESLSLTIDESWGVTEVRKENIIGYRFYPHKVKGEGFFLSVIRKKESSNHTHGKIRSKLVRASEQIAGKVSSWINKENDYRLFQHNDLVFAIPAKLENDINQLLQHLKLVYVGTNIATIKHDKAIPEHALALSLILDRSGFNNIDVDLNTALEYLRRNTISLPGQPRGYSLLTYQDTPLGWVNVLDNRVNNLYPQEWRIRMSDKKSQS